jgi:hypothetical protein
METRLSSEEITGQISSCLRFDRNYHGVKKGCDNDRAIKSVIYQARMTLPLRILLHFGYLVTTKTLAKLVILKVCLTIMICHRYTRLLDYRLFQSSTVLPIVKQGV